MTAWPVKIRSKEIPVSLSLLRSRRAILLAALGIAAAAPDVDAEGCTKKCQNKPKNQRANCRA
jgi:hypothetical protein